MSEEKPRTLKDLLDNINFLLKVNEDYMNLPLIYSSDDEGNSYHPVWFSLSPGRLDDDGYFIMEENEKPECICIN